MSTFKKKEYAPRVGIPYRTRNEELKGVREKYEMYLQSVKDASGMPVEISLGLTPSEVRKMAQGLDAIVLPGSPADVNPERYGTARHPMTADSDAAREATDLALLQHCFEDGKPVLAICYGVQILNVFRDGSLTQDIPSEVQTSVQHPWRKGEPEPFHSVSIDAKSRVALVSGELEQRVNSSHHQAIREPGRSLRVTARASDGIIEAVEWTGDANWVVGVQWHPERMTGDPFAQKLFADLIATARNAAVRG